VLSSATQEEPGKDPGLTQMKLFRLVPLAFAASVLLASPAGSQTSGTELKVGDPAPDFTLPATDGKTYSLSKDLKGKWVVLAWFPKAFTAG